MDADDPRDEGDARRVLRTRWLFVVFGVLVVGVAAAQGVKDDALGLWLAVGVVIAVLVISFPNSMLSRHRALASQRVPNATETELLATDHTRVVKLALPADAAFDLALKAIRTVIKHKRVSEANRVKGLIRAWTWDCRIRINIEGEGMNASKVIVRSRARALQKVDDGKNLGNVVELEAWLRKHAPAAATIEEENTGASAGG